MTRYPRLLDNRLAEISRLTPISQSIDLTLKPLSTANISMQDASEIEMRAYIELYTHKGSAGVFRVSGKETGYGGETDRVSLEHGLCVLGDAVIPEDGEKSGKLKTVLKALIAYQTTKIGGEKAWQIGDVETDEEITYQYTHPNVLEAVLGAVEEVQGYHLEFDQSALPWTLHVRKDATEPSCEGRLSRNVTAAHISLDDTNLCTRVYCPLLSDGYIQLEENPKWGIVSHYIGGNSDISESKLKKLLRQYLRARKDPDVAIEIDGIELSEITGEPLDRFDVGRMMRLALPDYGVTVNERIESISYTVNFLAGEDMEQVHMSLKSMPVDVSLNLSSIVGASNRQASGSVRGGGGGVGGGLRSSRSNLTSLLDQADDIEEINGKMTHWFNVVGVDLDAKNDAELKIFAYGKELTATNERVNRAEITLNGQQGRIDIHATKLVNIEAELTNIKKLFAGESTIAKAVITTLVAQQMQVKSGFTFEGLACRWRAVKLPTYGTMPSLQGYTVKMNDGSVSTFYAFNDNDRTVSFHTENPGYSFVTQE